MPLRPDVLLIGLCVLMVDLSLLGVMERWNVGLGDASIITLSMAIGLSVDYVVHISHAITSEEREQTHDKSAGDRIATALDKVGSSVFKGPRRE